MSETQNADQTKKHPAILDIDMNHSSKDSIVLSIFLLFFFAFAMFNNIFDSEVYVEESTFPFDTNCQTKLKHVAFELSSMKMDNCPMKIDISFKINNNIIKPFYNISFDVAMTHTYQSKSYLFHRFQHRYALFGSSKPGMVTDPVTIYTGMVPKYDSLFISLTAREDISEFSSLVATVYYDPSPTDLSYFFTIFACVSCTILLINHIINFWYHRKEIIPKEFYVTFVLLVIGAIIFWVLMFSGLNSFFGESLVSVYSAALRGFSIWVILNLVVKDTSKLNIIIILLSSAIAAVEVSEAGIIYASVSELTKLDFPLIILYDCIFLVTAVYGNMKIEEKKKSKLSKYLVLGTLMMFYCTFISLRLSDSNYDRMRNTIQFFKRVVVFGYLMCIVSFHVIQIQKVKGE